MAVLPQVQHSTVGMPRRFLSALGACVLFNLSPALASPPSKKLPPLPTFDQLLCSRNLQSPSTFPLHEAVEAQDAEKAKVLLKGGTDLGLINPNGFTPLDLALVLAQRSPAAFSFLGRFLALLLENQLHAPITGSSGAAIFLPPSQLALRHANSLLHYLTAEWCKSCAGRAEMSSQIIAWIQEYLGHQWIETLNSNGQTALALAVERGDWKMAHALLIAGAHPLTSSARGSAPTPHAALVQKVSEIESRIFTDNLAYTLSVSTENKIAWVLEYQEQRKLLADMNFVIRLPDQDKPTAAPTSKIPFGFRQ